MKIVLISGLSGSGKSTLAALLARVWDPDSGSISIGGVDLHQDSQDHIRSVVTLAPQRAHVFNDSIRANLLLARPDASDAELKDALEAVDLSQWIAAESEGIDTKVGEMGERISGGQRQRLALARALIIHPSLLRLLQHFRQIHPLRWQQPLDHELRSQSSCRALAQVLSPSLPLPHRPESLSEQALTF